jgi:hypothetical protein
MGNGKSPATSWQELLMLQMMSIRCLPHTIRDTNMVVCT